MSSARCQSTEVTDYEFDEDRLLDNASLESLSGGETTRENVERPPSVDFVSLWIADRRATIREPTRTSFLQRTARFLTVLRP